MSELSMFQSPPAGAIGGSVAAAPKAVTFMIGTQEYGLPVADVIEIVPIPAMLILVGAPTYLIGLLNRRGRYLPVLDGRILLGEPARYDLARYVIIAGRASANEEHVTPLIGILVDQVCDVRMFEDESLTPLGAGVAAPFLDSVARWADHSVLLFKLEELLALAPSISVDVTSL
jgi:purine-binding chemotaxis protein CheW